MEEQKHFVLVHGACHGAWSWYKIEPLLEAAGHRVTVLDMAGAGVNREAFQELKSFAEYSEPLLKAMDGIGPNEKVILVGHSFGGMSSALAMEIFPQKIAVSVFFTAFVPDTHHSPSFIFDKFLGRTPNEFWMDTQFPAHENTAAAAAEPSNSFLLGQKCLAKNFYQHSPSEDLALAKSLVRTGSLFTEELAKAERFTEENYGSVRKVYVICSEDKAIPKQFQKWMLENGGIENVMEIEGADHMPMFSKPLQVFQCLLQVAQNYT